MKFKSYGFWTALAGASTLFVGAVGKCFGFSIESGLVEDVIMAFAGILVVLGIVCMPIDKEKNEEKNKEDINDDINDDINAELKNNEEGQENAGNQISEQKQDDIANNQEEVEIKPNNEDE